ncbi:MAG: response regulator [Candidatus Zixiibacteriota bacterium]
MRVLIADDDPVNRLMLETFLHEWNYETLSCEDGTSALHMLSQDNPPKLAILDWIMPDIDGIKICQALNQKKSDSFIYIILLTSKSNREDMLEAFEAGAHDFLSKPFDEHELRSRLAVGEKIVDYERIILEKNEKLKKYANEMELLAQRRAKQLVHSDRLATVGIMSAQIAHEINNPVAYISGNIDNLLDFWQYIQKAMEDYLKKANGDLSKFQFALKETPDILDEIKDGVKRITEISKSLRQYTYSGNNRSTKLTDINASIIHALELSKFFLKNHIQVELELQDNIPEIPIDSQEFEQVLINLFNNATGAMTESDIRRLYISSIADQKQIQIQVEDTGTGFEDEVLNEIWKPFFTTKKQGEGTGLGLPISKYIIENYNGSIVAENSDKAGHGARFVITFDNSSTF